MQLCVVLFKALLSACPGHALTCLPLLQLHTRCSRSAQHSTSHIANTSLAMQTQQARKLACWRLIACASRAEGLKGSVSACYPSNSYWTLAQALREAKVITLNWNNLEMGSNTALAPLDEHNKNTVENNINIFINNHRTIMKCNMEHISEEKTFTDRCKWCT